MVASNVPPCATYWTAKNVYELAHGLQVAENLQLSPSSQALFFANNSPLASTDSFKPPTEDNLVRVMAKLVAGCQMRQAGCSSAMFKRLVCSGSVRQPELKLNVAERVRAELDGKKTLRCDHVIALGGSNAAILAEALGATFVEAPTVSDLRTFFEATHFQAAVERIFIWLDIGHKQFQLAHQAQLVPALRDVILAAARWSHIQFIVLPVPYAASLLPTFSSFMQEFNKIHVNLPNVLWLSDRERVDVARFVRSLGCNEFVTDFTSVTKEGLVRRKAARAALRFVRQLKPNLVPEHVDLSDPLPPQQSTSSPPSVSAPGLPGVRKTIQKHPRGSDSSRGAPNKPGGGGSRGKSGNNNGQWNKHRGQGNNRKGQGKHSH